MPRHVATRSPRTPTRPGLFTPQNVAAASNAIKKGYQLYNDYKHYIRPRPSYGPPGVPGKFVVKQLRARDNVVMTPGKKARYTNKRYGAAWSKSAGFLKQKRQGKKMELKGARGAALGVTGTFEHGTTIQARECLYVGHATGPRDVVMLYAMMALIKALSKQMGVRISAIDEPMTNSGYVVNDEFRLIYSSEPNTLTVSTQAASVGPGESFSVVAQKLANLAFTGTDLTNVQFLELQFVPLGTTSFQKSRIALQYTTLTFVIKSAIKMQNRSVNAAGETVDNELDAVPVYGKSIAGKGTGTQALFPNTAKAPANIVCSLVNGSIEQDNLDTRLKEPLSGYFFPKSKKQGKIHLDPAQIKTNVLTYKRSLTLGTLFKEFYHQTGPPIAPFGNFCFFQVEKMIDTGVNFDIIIAYEIDYNISCWAKPKSSYVTAPQFQKF